jgi:uncharacterized protein YbcI
MSVSERSPNGAVSRPGLEISNAIVQILRAYTGRGPNKARTHFSDNLVAVVMQDTMTKGERVLFENGKGDLVREMRRCYQETMRDAMVASVEEHTGGKVIAFMSDNHLDPDMAIESFILETP